MRTLQKESHSGPRVYVTMQAVVTWARWEMLSQRGRRSPMAGSDPLALQMEISRRRKWMHSLWSLKSLVPPVHTPPLQRRLMHSLCRRKSLEAARLCTRYTIGGQ